MKPTLLILAAGMGSRYGALKQMDELGPGGETIIDYSVYDAIQAGFDKVVFVIRESFADAFKERFEPRIKGKIKYEFVFQELDKLPEGFTLPEGREKPWGTGHAILMAKDAIDTPFAIINADDFYGREAFIQVNDFVQNSAADNEYAMVGYALKNTLSDFGTVSRGICETDKNSNLVDITERTEIGTENGQVYYAEDGVKNPLTGDEPVSMNFWAFKPSFFEHLQTQFIDFLKARGTELKSEFYFNAVANSLIKSGEASTKVICTDAQWFGVTYQEDKPLVQQKIKDLITAGVYPAELWA